MELYALREPSTPDSDLQEVDIYYLEEILQKGKGCTRLLKASSAEYEDETLAVKLFPKTKNGQCCSGYINEEKTVSKLSHPFLVKYYNFYKDALIQGKKDTLTKYSSIVMEYVPAGDLFTKVSQQPFSEKMARTFFKQMISVIEYLHSQKLAHLDLKLENFLLTSTGIKLIDFDGSQDFETKSSVSLPAGTPGYRPPEFVKGGFQDLKAADVYSLGIVLFTMVTGTPPYSETEEEGTYKFDKYYETLRKDPAKFWKVHEHYRAADSREPFSKEFQQLIEAMLKEKPQDRYRIDQIKRSLWLEGKTFTSEELKGGLKCHY